MPYPPRFRRREMSGSKAETGARHSPPGFAALKQWFAESGLPLQERQYQLLWQYHRLIRKRNAEYDLTRIYQFDNMVQKHYIDCVLAAKLMKWKLPSPLLDIGTGPGLPGIPLKIVCPDTELILSEGRHKRVQFLHEVVQTLGLNGVEVYGHKIHSSFNRRVSGVITRALESIPKTLSRVTGCLVQRGLAIFMKGPQCGEELEIARKTLHDDFRLIMDKAYTIPHSPHRRRLVVYERISDTAA
ncbi:MAG: 16S rRNA (guanine(527)-N(7))-methyltransferase RsmG [Desulfobacteraceae bacterium]|nr:MAG: 16S rRNA (guanine(527)-N(7))-methyltransferase RsmG [Desulfobacteraceae bacterium]